MRILTHAIGWALLWLIVGFIVSVLSSLLGLYFSGGDEDWGKIGMAIGCIIYLIASALFLILV